MHLGGVMLHVLEHTLIDSLKMLPFLFLAYLLIEYIEHSHSKKIEKALGKSGKYGPFVGALLGLIPQCGFSVIASGLYMNQSISLGTLLAVFIATSDDAIPILIAQPKQAQTLFVIIGLKIIVAIVVGYLVDGLIQSHRISNNHSLHDIHEHCKEEEHGHGIIYLALLHTFKIFVFNKILYNFRHSSNITILF